MRPIKIDSAEESEEENEEEEFLTERDEKIKKALKNAKNLTIDAQKSLEVPVKRTAGAGLSPTGRSVETLEYINRRLGDEVTRIEEVANNSRKNYITDTENQEDFATQRELVEDEYNDIQEVIKESKEKIAKIEEKKEEKSQIIIEQNTSYEATRERIENDTRANWEKFNETEKKKLEEDLEKLKTNHENEVKKIVKKIDKLNARKERVEKRLAEDLVRADRLAVMLDNHDILEKKMVELSQERTKLQDEINEMRKI